MKELSIKEKAKAYDEALEKARQLCAYPTSKPFISDLQDLFPELKESEDERIRKELISFFTERAKYTEDSTFNGLSSKEIIAWLEKQVEKTKPIEGFNTEFERQVSCLIVSAMNRDYKYTKDFIKWTSEGLLNYAKREFEKNSMGISEATKKKLEDSLNKALEKETPESCNEFLEKQGEQKSTIEMKTPEESLGIDSDTYNKIVDECIYGKQKPADKVEPKFKVGDWVVSPNGVYWHIDKISNNRYEVTSNTGKSADWPLDTNIYHSFTIQDAKDGDVLYLQKDEKEHIIIYKGVIKERFRAFVSAYCAYNGIVEDFCFADVSRYVDIAYGGIMPATKEQRDILFQKMKEAGYEWDVDKKELTKIEQKPAWSEEDKINLEKAIWYVENPATMVVKDSMLVEWLKSLKDRYTWKPSDEQMEALRKAEATIGVNHVVLAGLISDLEKLTE